MLSLPNVVPEHTSPPFVALRRHISTESEGNEALADLLLNASGNLQELLVSKQLIQAFRIVKLIGKSVLDDSNDTFNEGDIIEVRRVPVFAIFAMYGNFSHAG